MNEPQQRPILSTREELEQLREKYARVVKKSHNRSLALKQLSRAHVMTKKENDGLEARNYWLHRENKDLQTALDQYRQEARSTSPRRSGVLRILGFA